jgi:hypothetical protein
MLKGTDLGLFPLPPIGMVADPFWHALVTYSNFAFAIVATVWALIYWKKKKTTLPLLMLLGGAISTLLEPFADTVSLLWHARYGQWIVFETFGRPIPLWMLLMYYWFIGGLSVYTLNRIDKGLTVRGFWRLYVIYVIGEGLCEFGMLFTGIYTYYGAQPFCWPPVMPLPLWFPIVNGLLPFTAALMINKTLPFLKGWKMIGVVAMVPMSSFITWSSVAWPIWNALNTNHGLMLTYPAGIATILLSLFCAHLMSLFCCTDAPKAA